MALKPASMKASSKANEVGWSTFQPNTLPPSIKGAMWSSERPRRRRSIRLPQRGVELLQRRPAGAELLLAQRVERPVDRAQMGVQVFRVLFDIEQAGDDLALGSVGLQEAQGRRAVVQVVVGVELAQRELGAVVLLDDLDRAGLVVDLDRHEARHEIEPVHRL